MEDEAMAGQIFGVEQDPNLIAKQAEILALRQITDTLRVINGEIKEGRERHERVLEGLGEVKRDIAVMKEQNKAVEDIRATLAKHDTRIDVLENRQTQLDGATNLVKWMREFGPWIVSLMILAWSLFEKAPVK